MSFEKCVQDMVQRKDISQDYADLVMERFGDDLARGTPRAQARSRAAKAIEAYKALQYRQALLQAPVSRTNDAHLTRYRGLRKGPTGQVMHAPIDAAYGLFEDFGYAGTINARGQMEAARGIANSMMTDAFKKFERSGLGGGRKNRGQAGDLQRAMFGESATPEMQELAKGVLDACDYLRRTFNDLSGDTIPKLDYWGGPQMYDRHAVEFIGRAKTVAEAKDNFANLFDTRLNWAKMRDPLTAELYGNQTPSDRERRRILDRAWENIVTGGARDDDPKMAPGHRRSLANSRSDHRFFVFRDAQAKDEVARQVGFVDVLSNVDAYINSLSTDIGLMRVFGPNVVGEISRIKDFIRTEGERLTRGQPTLLEGVKRGDPVRNAVARADKTIDGYYQQFKGANVNENWLSLSGSVLRNVGTSALMGSAIINHVAQNPFIQVLGRHMGGVPLYKTIPEILSAFKGASREEITRAGLDLEQASFQLLHYARDLRGLRRIERSSRWLPDRTIHLSGLHAVIKANKDAFRRGMMSMLGDLHDKPWDAIPEKVKRKMEGYGIDERQWQLMQMAEVYQPDLRSAPWLRFKEVMDLGRDNPAGVLSLYPAEDMFDSEGNDYAHSEEGKAEASRISNGVAMNLLAYIQGETEVAVPSHSMRMNSWMRGGADPTTIWGQLRISSTMFKGYLGSYMLTQFLGIQHAASRSKLGAASYFATAMIGATIFGIIVLCFKAMENGKDIPELDLTTPEGLGTLAKAMVTGYAFGWVGDYLTQKIDSWGHGPLEALAGPAAGTVFETGRLAVDVMLAGKAALVGERKRGEAYTKVVRDLDQLGRYSTPIISNLWYAKAAFDRDVIDVLHWLAAPWDHKQARDQEKALQKSTGQHFYWNPWELAPSRPPGLTHRGQSIPIL